MKPAFAAAAALLFAAPALAQTSSMPDAHADAAASVGTAQAEGQIKSVDARAGTVTIHHAPIPALGWPAMTMTFKAAPDALKGARPGQAVKFTLNAADDQVLAIQPR